MVRTSLFLLVILAACEPVRQEPDVRWYRGNLHTHTLWSDGDDFPDMVVDWYRSRGYDFLSLSDHNTLSAGERWIHVDSLRRPLFEEYVAHLGRDGIDTIRVADSTRARLKTFEELSRQFNQPGRFILIQAEEITESVGSLPVHMNATNIKEFIPPQGGSTVAEVLQRNIDAVLDQRERTGQAMFPHINHPNFGWGVSLDDLLAVRGERFFEVYNGHPLVHNRGDADHPSVEEMWDVLLAARVLGGRPLLFGLAVDDAHHYHGMDPALANPGRGWVMVRADTLTPIAIVEAMEAGLFYSSTGVSLRDVRWSEGRLAIDIAAESGVRYRTEFIGSAAAAGGGDPSVGVTLSSVEGDSPSYSLRGDELYVRAKVVSTKPVQNPTHAGDTEAAWTQPVVPNPDIR